MMKEYFPTGAGAEYLEQIVDLVLIWLFWIQGLIRID